MTETFRNFALSRLRCAAHGDERGSVSIAAAILVPALIIMLGLVVDGGGKVEAARRADAAAVAAVRYGGDAAASNVAAGQNPNSVAYAAARRYLSQAGVSSTVVMRGRTLTVTTTETYDTVILQAVGIGSLQGRGEASARIAPVTPQ